MKMTLLLCASLLALPLAAETDPETGRFSYAVNNPFVDDTLARIALIPLHTARGNSGTTPVERTELVGHGIALLRHQPVWSTRPWSLWSDQPRDQPKHPHWKIAGFTNRLWPF